MREQEQQERVWELLWLLWDRLLQWCSHNFWSGVYRTAISALNGAAAINAALAWLGGGALAVGGGGMAAGEAFLALAGPVGWAIAGVSLVVSGLFFWKSSSDKKRLEKHIYSYK